jgi:hypothetical protein
LETPQGGAEKFANFAQVKTSLDFYAVKIAEIAGGALDLPALALL